MKKLLISLLALLVLAGCAAAPANNEPKLKELPIKF